MSSIEELIFKFTAAENSNIYLNMSEEFALREASQEGWGVSPPDFCLFFLMNYNTAACPTRGCTSVIDPL